MYASTPPAAIIASAMAAFLTALAATVAAAFARVVRAFLALVVVRGGRRARARGSRGGRGDGRRGYARGGNPRRGACRSTHVRACCRAAGRSARNSRGRARLRDDKTRDKQCRQQHPCLAITSHGCFPLIHGIANNLSLQQVYR